MRYHTHQCLLTATTTRDNQDMADVICPGELLIDFAPTQTGMNLRSVADVNKLPGTLAGPGMASSPAY